MVLWDYFKSKINEYYTYYLKGLILKIKDHVEDHTEPILCSYPRCIKSSGYLKTVVNKNCNLLELPRGNIYSRARRFITTVKQETVLQGGSL